MFIKGSAEGQNPTRLNEQPASLTILRIKGEEILLLLAHYNAYNLLILQLQQLAIDHLIIPSYIMPVEKGNTIVIAESDIAANPGPVNWQQNLSQKSDTYYMSIFTNKDKSMSSSYVTNVSVLICHDRQ